MLFDFFRRSPRVYLVLTALEDAAARDCHAATALLDYLLLDDGNLEIREAGDFCDLGDIITPEAEIKMATKSRRTIISHRLTLEEAGRGGPLPFEHPPVLKIDGKQIPIIPTDLVRLSQAVRIAWGHKNVMSPLLSGMAD